MSSSYQRQAELVNLIVDETLGSEIVWREAYPGSDEFRADWRNRELCYSWYAAERPTLRIINSQVLGRPELVRIVGVPCVEDQPISQALIGLDDIVCTHNARNKPRPTHHPDPQAREIVRLLRA